MKRRMLGDGEAHVGEHDWISTCDDYPECTPVDPNHYDPPPSHYEGGGIEPWKVVDSWGLDYYLGNVLKYVCRAGKKDIATRLDDLKKARNYINKAIELEEKE